MIPAAICAVGVQMEFNRTCFEIEPGVRWPFFGVYETPRTWQHSNSTFGVYHRPVRSALKPEKADYLTGSGPA
jgi:hypothetical protein